MPVTILLFSPFSDAVGKKKIEIQMKDNEKASIKELLKELREEYPKLQALLPEALNKNGIYGNLFPVRGDEMLQMDDEIHDQDTIKIYGSLSGG